MKNIEELNPPHTIQNASRAMELARIWIVDGSQHVAISRNLWDDPAAWGLMLVDLAKHVANAYAKEGRDKQEVLNRILEGFNAETQSTTDDPTPCSLS
jgi:hypothetical protein